MSNNLFICLKVLSFKNNIPNEFGSQPNIFKIIDDAVNKKYLIKQLSKEDKRKFNLFTSEILLKSLKSGHKYLKVFKNFCFIFL
jgi:adenosine deaminase